MRYFRSCSILLATLASLVVASALRAQAPYPAHAESLAYWIDSESDGRPGVTVATAFESYLAADSVVAADYNSLSTLDGIAELKPAVPAGQCKAPAAKPDAAKEKPPVIKSLTPFTGKCGGITFTPGLRVQPRYIYDDGNDNNDFLIRRFRLKCSGDAFEIAKYGMELKIDSTGRFEADPKAEVENAWLDFKTSYESVFVRVGLYDIPFSYNALTSDSKLLLMDRTLIKESLTTLGLTDNTIGVMVHGRPYDGRFEYAAGVFDNVAFEKFGTTGIRESDELMPAGRVAWHLLDPATPADGYADYKESYIGEGQRLTVGLNSACLGDAIEGPNEFDLFAYGTDIFFNSGRYTLQAEYDLFTEDMIGGNPDIDGDGWYVQGGYLLGCCGGCAVELAARHQELDRDNTIANDRLRWSSLGLNLYIRDHNLKIQTDYTFKREQGIELDNDLLQTQLQLDY